MSTERGEPVPVAIVTPPRLGSPDRSGPRRDNGIAIEEVSDADDPDALIFESGGVLPSPYATLAGPTVEEWLQR